MSRAIPNRANSGWNSLNRGISCRNGQLTGAPSAVKAGLIRFYRGVTVPWGFEDYARLPRAPFIADPHLYPLSPRRHTYGSMASAAIGNPLAGPGGRVF